MSQSFEYFFVKYSLRTMSSLLESRYGKITRSFALDSFARFNTGTKRSLALFSLQEVSMYTKYLISTALLCSKKPALLVSIFLPYSSLQLCRRQLLLNRTFLIKEG